MTVVIFGNFVVSVLDLIAINFQNKCIFTTFKSLVGDYLHRGACLASLFV